MQNVKSFKELYEVIENQLRAGYCKNPFVDTELKPETMKEIEDLVYINKLGLWTFDSQPSMQYLTYQDFSRRIKCSWFKRGYLTGIMNRSSAFNFAKIISKKGKFVFVFQPDGPNYFYKNGFEKLLTTDLTEDLTVTYCIKHRKNGNPYLKQYAHIWNYGSDIDTVEGYFDNKELENTILNNNVELCIVEPDFYSKDSLIKIVADTLENLPQ